MNKSDTRLKNSPVLKASGWSVMEGFVDRFLTPDEIWQMTFPVKNAWHDKFN